ncbi:uncharacterized protein AB9W97_013442 isoform 2-T2 [Spinachia spinachia]
MANRGHNGGADVTDELLYTSSRKDPCDLLLDAIDAQLGQLQVQPRKYQSISREIGGIDADSLIWSQSLSKDTGFGSTTQTNDTPLSCLDLIHTPKMDHKAETTTRLWEDPLTDEETVQKSDRIIRDSEGNVTQREQVIWRLRRLLGDACNEAGTAGESHPPSDSICTEDFVRRFRDEMVQSELPASHMKRIDQEEVTSGFDDCLSEQKGRSIFNARTSSSWEVNTSCSETTGAEVRCSNQRSFNENVPNRSSKAQLKRRQAYRLVRSSGDGDKDTDWRGRSRTQRTPEKMQSDWAKMNTRLSTLRQKCEKEEMTLQKKKSQIKAVDLFLSELQQRRKHALQELKRLTVETAKMETQKRTLMSFLRDNRAREDSIGALVQEPGGFSRQRDEPCTLMQPEAVTSVLQREETRGQLDKGKTEALAEQRRETETRASVQALGCQLGECKIRVGTPDEALAQKELQMFDWHVERRALQAERDGGLRRELQHMQILQREAHDEAHGAMLKEEETKMLRASLQQQQNQQEQRNALEKESRRALLRLERTAQVAEKEADKLRRMREDSEGSHNQTTAELERQLGRWAQELGAECRHLHLLVEQSGAQQSAVLIAHRPTAAEALAHLRTLREQLKHLINHLQRELHSEKETTEQQRKDMELQLGVQRQQLRMEKGRALDSLKERLIQEHIEELSGLNWAHACEGRAEVGGMVASLRKQLRAKDLELRQLQRSMGRWQERTAARLACKFEDALTTELERCKAKLVKARKPSEPREESLRDPMKPETEMTQSADVDTL